MIRMKMLNKVSVVFFLIVACMLGACTKPEQPAGNESKPQPTAAKSGRAGKTIGEYDPGNTTFYLRTSHSEGGPEIVFSHGPSGQALLPVAGDWDGDGKTGIGLYDPKTGAWYLRNSVSAGPADMVFAFGPKEGFLPVAGDWDGDGKDSPGLYNPNT